MSRANGVHADTCPHNPIPCDLPLCSACTCDPSPLTTALAERDRARDIAARLEAELATLKELVVFFAHTDSVESAIFLDEFLDGAIIHPAEPIDPADRTPWPHPDAEVGT